MIVIICAKYRKNPSRTVDATERTRFSKSRPNDLEDIGQGQRSWCATHPLMVVIICAQYEKNPSITVDDTERTRHAGRTDGQTDGRSETSIPPPTTSLCGGYNYNLPVANELIDPRKFVWLLQWRWSNPEAYGWNQSISTHNKTQPSRNHMHISMA